MSSPRTLLLIAADHDWADIAALRLVALGCCVRRAATVPEALAAGARQTIHVVLVDERSFTGDLSLLLERWRERNAASHVIVLLTSQSTGRTEPLVGVDRCLARSRPWRDIEHAVEEALDAAPSLHHLSGKSSPDLAEVSTD